MPREISIPGVGEITFPDSMTESEVNAAAKKLYDDAQAGKNVFSNVVSRSSSAPAQGELSKLAAQRKAGIEAEPGQTLTSRFGEAMGRTISAADSPLIKGAVRALPLPMSNEILGAYESVMSLAGAGVGEGLEAAGAGEVAQEVGAEVVPQVIEDVLTGGPSFKVAKAAVGGLRKAATRAAPKAAAAVAETIAREVELPPLADSISQMRAELLKHGVDANKLPEPELKVAYAEHRAKLQESAEEIAKGSTLEEAHAADKDLQDLIEEGRAARESGRPVVQTESGPIIKNEPASPEMDAGVAAVAGSDDPAQVVAAAAADSGIPPPEVTVGQTPISRTVKQGDGTFRVDLETGKPTEAVHEVRHVEEQTGGRAVPEDNTQLALDFINRHFGAATEGPIPKYAGSVNLTRRITPETAKRLTEGLAKQMERTGPVSYRAMIESAERMLQEQGMTIQEAADFSRRFANQSNLQDIFKVRMVDTAAGEDLDAAVRVWNQTGTEQSRQAALKALETKLTVFEAANNIASQAGRVLGSHRMEVGGVAAIGQAKKAALSLLNSLKGKGKLTQEIQDLALRTDWNDSASVAKLMQLAGPADASWWRKVLEMSNSGLMSDPVSQSRNFLSNMVNVLGVKALKVGAGVLADIPLSAIRGVPRSKFLGEIPRYYAGVAESIVPALKNGLKYLRTEIPAKGTAGETLIQTPSLSGAVGKSVRFPGYTLAGAADQFARTLARGGLFRSETFREAAQQAIQKNLTAEQFTDLYAAMKKSPSRELLEKVDLGAAAGVYQEGMGPFASWINQGRHKFWPMNFLIRFLQTPTSIGKEGIKMTPLGALRNWKKVAAKGDDVLAEELAKPILGFGMAGGVVALRASDSITGAGPTDSARRNAWLGGANNLHQPYSIRVGDKWISYQGLGPLSIAIGTTANALESMEDAEESGQAGDYAKAMGAIAAGFTKVTMDQTFLKGVSDFLDAATDPTAKFGKFIEDNARTFIPFSGVLSGAARAADDEFKRAAGLLQKIAARTPRWSEIVPPRRDVRGHPILREGSFWEGLLSPVRRGTIQESEMETILINNDKGIGDVDKRRVIGEGAIQLDPWSYDALQVLSGAYVDRGLRRLAQDTEKWAALDQEEKVKRIKEAVTDGRKEGWEIYKRQLQQQVWREFEQEYQRLRSSKKDVSHLPRDIQRKALTDYEHQAMTKATEIINRKYHYVPSFKSDSKEMLPFGWQQGPRMKAQPDFDRPNLKRTG